MTLTKSHLVDAIAEQNGFSKKKSTETVETILEIIKSTLVSVRMSWLADSASSVSRKKERAKDGIRQPARIWCWRQGGLWLSGVRGNWRIGWMGRGKVRSSNPIIEINRQVLTSYQHNGDWKTKKEFAMKRIDYMTVAPKAMETRGRCWLSWLTDWAADQPTDRWKVWLNLFGGEPQGWCFQRFTQKKQWTAE